MNVNDALKQAINTRYLRSTDYNRSYGLTLFMQEIEKKAKQKEINFTLISSSVKLLKTRDDEKKEAIKSFENWVKFIYENKLFYIQFDYNPFFEAAINVYELNHDMQTYAEFRKVKIFEYIDLEYFKYNGKENANHFKKELLKEFKKALIKERNTPTLNFKKVKDLKEIIYTY